MSHVNSGEQFSLLARFRICRPRHEWDDVTGVDVILSALPCAKLHGSGGRMVRPSQTSQSYPGKALHSLELTWLRGDGPEFGRP